MFNQENYNIRLQKLICCIGNIGGEIQSMIAVGNDCYKEKLEKLKILQGYLEVLECYSLEEETLSTAIIDISEISGADETIEIFVNGISISGEYITTSSDHDIEEEGLVSQINNYQSVYVAVRANSIITITGTCSNNILTALTSNGVELDITNFSGGNCVDNCVTEDQVLSMFDRVSTYCDICFPNPEYIYN